MIKKIKGDLIKLAKAGEFDIIMHGCNCWTTMGAGIAKTIRDEFPAAYAADLAQKHDRPINKLGDYSIGTEEIGFNDSEHLDIVNLYTQYNMGAQAEYAALRQALQLFVGEHFLTTEKIGIPEIGCGIGGLSIEIVSIILEEELGHLDVTLVEWEEPKREDYTFSSNGKY